MVDTAQDLVTLSIAAMFLPRVEECGMLEENPSPSQIFGRMLSINKRKKLSQFFRSGISDFPAYVPEEEILLHISLAAVGTYTIFGSFCQSLLAVIQAHDGQKISDMMWLDEMPQTSIPSVDRIAAGDKEFKGADQSRRRGAGVRGGVDNRSGVPSF